MFEERRNTLVDRLRGIYQVGPIDENGNGEFGQRGFSDFIPPISYEAAIRIEELEKENKRLNEIIDDLGRPF